MNHLTDPQKKDRPKSLSFCSENTVTDDQQAAPVHSGPPFFGFRAYAAVTARTGCLPHAVRSQGSENCCRYPKWVISESQKTPCPRPLFPQQRTLLHRVVTSEHLHITGSRRAHSTTSSARNRNDSGISKPSALAVFRLMTRSNLVGCWTGKSAGFAPRKILSTKLAASRNSSVTFAP
jgi:hypothetical protein